MNSSSSIQLIRNATVVFNYGGKKILIDPMLADQGAYPGFEGTVNSHLRNPLVGLPVAAESLFDVDAIIVTHLHPDHWDAVAASTLPKDKPVFSQNEDDAAAIRGAGFKDVRMMSEATKFEGLTFAKTHCQHGSDQAYAIPQVAAVLGQASGLYFNAEGEKSVYFVGDSVWTAEIESNLERFQPDVVIVNAGFAELPGLGGIIFGKQDVQRVNRILPDALIISIHMEAVNHCTLTRAELAAYVEAEGFTKSVIIPQDGQTINL